MKTLHSIPEIFTHTLWFNRHTPCQNQYHNEYESERLDPHAEHGECLLYMFPEIPDPIAFRCDCQCNRGRELHNVHYTISREQFSLRRPVPELGWSGYFCPDCFQDACPTPPTRE